MGSSLFKRKNEQTCFELLLKKTKNIKYAPLTLQ